MDVRLILKHCTGFQLVLRALTATLSLITCRSAGFAAAVDTAARYVLARFTRSHTLTFNRTASTRDFGHRRPIRSGNQTPPLNSCRPRFLYQGHDSKGRW